MKKYCPECNAQIKGMKYPQIFECPICSVFLHENRDTKQIVTLLIPTIGMEVESFTIDTERLEILAQAPFYPDNKVGVELDENFTNDVTIGSEFNSPVFTSINKAAFRMKSSLRKYSMNMAEARNRQIALLGSFTDELDTAGVHYHLGFKDTVEIDDIVLYKVAVAIHQQVPFLIAILANSSLLRGADTSFSSNRLIHNGPAMFRAISREKIGAMKTTKPFHELYYSPPKGKKPHTLEIRVCDSNLPEYIIAGFFIIKTVTIGAIAGKKAWEQYNHQQYIQDRLNVARNGMNATIHWNGQGLNVPQYIDKFFKDYKRVIELLQFEKDVLAPFKLAKKGWAMADIIREAYRNIKKKYLKGQKKYILKEFILHLVEAQENNLDGDGLKQFITDMGIHVSPYQDVKLAGEY
ncbi:hypothetical protein GF325_07115 [Candidatus Bathyarchaeota archaeon]|nr:hypothetical protein [Candidatus Bathyarchaeota archaeon]